MAEQLNLSSRAIRGMIVQAIESAPTTWANQISLGPLQSDQNSETYKWIGQSPAMREWIGGRLAKGLRTDGFTVANKKFESTLRIEVDDLRREKTGQLRTRISDLGARYNQHVASLLSTLIAAGETTLCYDGKYYFAANHASGASGTLKNLLTASEVSTLNVGTPAEPTPEEFAKAILGCVAYFYGFKDDQGEPINETASQFLVMVPVSLWASAMQATTMNMLATTAGGAINNPILGGPFSVNVVCNPRLTWTTNFAVFRTDGVGKPFLIQEEESLTVSAIAEGSEYEMLNDEHIYGIKWMGNVAPAYWQHAIKATLS